MKIRTILPLAVAITASILTHSIYGQVTHQAVITENSSTNLTATYDGVSVTVLNTATDQWRINFPSSANFNGPVADWLEPGNSSLGNNVSGPGGNIIFVSSDSGPSALAQVSDGSTVNSVGSDSGGSISATFHDNATTAEAVPEPSTLALLLFALAALLGVTRMHCLRRA